MSATDTVLFAPPEDGVAVITLNRPERRNALTFAMGERFAEIVEEVKADDAVRAVIVRGEGRAFCAGADFELLRGWAGAESEDAQQQMLSFYRLFLKVREIAVPTIAAVSGGAIGAGSCIALACDLRIAATDAKLAFNFVRLGLSPGMAATFNLPWLLGPAVALELLTTGRIVGGEEAARLGLVSRAVPATELLDAARALATEIATAAPLAVRRTKRAVRLAFAERDIDASLAFEAKSQSECYVSEDYREGMAAIREKRAPAYGGR